MSEPQSKSLKPGEVRGLLPRAFASDRRSLPCCLLFGAGVALYLATLIGTVAAPWWPLKLFFSFANTFFLGILFVIGHDACHSAFTPFGRLNAFLGRIAFLPSWHPYAGWEHAHNHVHHAWTNLRQKDYAWAAVFQGGLRSPAGVAANNRSVLSHAAGPGAYYLFEVYLKRTIFPNRAFRGHMACRFVGDCLLVLAFIVAQAAFLIFAPRWFGGGSSAVESLFFGQWLPFLIWNWLIALLIFLHHTHPRIPWFDDSEEWSFYKGQILGTVHVQFPGPINWVIHNIMEHTAHHADPRAPLSPGRSAESLAQAFPDDIVEHKFTWAAFATPCEVASSMIIETIAGPTGPASRLRCAR